jgi:quercetin dioxygenase-like cupin family protein/alkylhydroperoxidase/carboxymuconolactone decarboxylase family protein YurZ
MKIKYNKIIFVIIFSLFAMEVSAQSQEDPGSLYAKGEKINSPNFTGTAWLNMIAGPQKGVNCTIGSVSFEPGARTNWHSHPGGQILAVTEGAGYYQEEGKPRRIIRKGDVITCLPNVVHWHGASVDTGMTHLAIGPDAATGPVVWLKKVTDQEYAAPAAQSAIGGREALNPRQRTIVSITAYTARGDLQNLNGALNEGLNAGLTINEIKEMLVQLYAYCGFPRSLNAINTFISVLNERKAKGINDPIGVPPSPGNSNANKYEMGKNNLERLTGRTENGPKTSYAEFAPVIDTFLKEHLFADIFSRGVLSYQERELTTISALVSLGGVGPQLQGHLAIGLHIGITEVQLKEMLSMLEISIGKKEADAGREVLSKVI